ncbi:transcriptional repressor [Candidatus Parcubacteria bacterium]|uniref:Transcriptional repressor n=1 Tax=Candidatus Kaiserbacteria bacterium CG10_big_fil_rev_8_21_14_0_10_47_16 TaxID=1974608 RepID=A0A2H0UEE2_9BACT|nr:transcriptional repressor [Candidatus Parcubacteria bacterium]PIR84794.1 MAG: hypothetical protein COU16_01245 [Candidatus Kaiserbacteria bacterium CG10_big_fil_rev_8_21_14_0_10_47_16]
MTDHTDGGRCDTDAHSTQLLQHAGLKATGSRIAILEVFLGSSKPISIDTLEQTIRTDAHLATLYRTVERLLAAGILMRVNLGDETPYYELRDEEHHHHHVVCTDCGRIEDIELCHDDSLEKEALHASKFFHRLDTHALEFFGTCTSCVPHLHHIKN